MKKKIFVKQPCRWCRHNPLHDDYCEECGSDNGYEKFEVDDEWKGRFGDEEKQI